MMRQIAVIILLSCNSALFAHPASDTTLHALQGYSFQVMYSPGAEQKAAKMARQINEVMQYYDIHFAFRPKVKLLILSPTHWNVYTNFPVYGMPHYNDAQTLIVASDNNPFWKSFIPNENTVPAEQRELFRNTYDDGHGSVTMEPFFDLLAIHELGHAYHQQDSLKIQRLWMGEVFSNIFLHTWVAEKNPKLLPALTLLPKMALASIPRSALTFTSLQELEKNYELIGKQYPNNYGWYQFRWHVAAGEVYDAGGPAALQKLRLLLKQEKRNLDDEQLANMLKEKVHPAMASMMLDWDRSRDK